MPPEELARLRSIASQAGADRRTLNDTTAAKNAKKNKRKLNPVQSLLASSLPMVGAGVGAVVGSVVPVYGTAIGGALGGSAGEFARQKITGEDTNLGRIGIEGALGSLPGAGAALKGAKTAVIGGRVAKAAQTADAIADTAKAVKVADTAVKATKAAKTATKAGKVINTTRAAKTLSQAEKAAKVAAGSVDDVARVAAGSVDDVAKTAAKKPGIMQKLGMGMTEKGSGLKVGKNVGDVNKLDDQAKFMAQFKGTPKQQMRQMDVAMKAAGNQVDDILKKTKVPVVGKDVSKGLLSNVDDLANPKYIDLDLGDPAARKVLDRYIAKIDTVTDASSLNKILKDINPVASQAQKILLNPAGKTLNAKQTAALAVKRHLDDVLTAIPEIKPYKQQMAKLFEVAPDVAKASTKSMGIPLLGIKSEGLAQMVKGGESRLGSLLQGGQKLAGQVATQGGGQSMLRQVAGATGRQAKSRILPAAMGAPFGGYYSGAFGGDQGDTGEELTPQNQQIFDELMNSDEMGGGEMTNGTTEQPMDNQSLSLFSDPDKIERAYTEALMNGDKETATLLLNGLNTFSKVREAANKAKATASGSTSGGLNVSKVTAQNASNAQAGMGSVAQLKRMIAEDPNIVTKTITPGRKLPMIGGYIANAAGTGKYDSEAYNIADAILRIRTGAAATESEVRNLMTSIIPRAGDSPDVVAHKLQLLERQFGNVLEMAGGGTSNVDESTEAVLSGGM